MKRSTEDAFESVDDRQKRELEFLENLMSMPKERLVCYGMLANLRECLDHGDSDGADLVLRNIDYLGQGMVYMAIEILEGAGR